MVKSEFHPEPPGSQNPHKSPQHHAVNIQAMDIGIGMKSVHEMEKRVSGLLFLRSHGCEHELELSGEGNGRAREDAPFFNLGDETGGETMSENTSLGSKTKSLGK